MVFLVSYVSGTKKIFNFNESKKTGQDVIDHLHLTEVSI